MPSDNIYSMYLMNTLYIRVDAVFARANRRREKRGDIERDTGRAEDDRSRELVVFSVHRHGNSERDRLRVCVRVRPCV